MFCYDFLKGLQVFEIHLFKLIQIYSDSFIQTHSASFRLLLISYSCNQIIT